MPDEDKRADRLSFARGGLGGASERQRQGGAEGGGGDRAEATPFCQSIVSSLARSLVASSFRFVIPLSTSDGSR